MKEKRRRLLADIIKSLDFVWTEHSLCEWGLILLIDPETILTASATENILKQWNCLFLTSLVCSCTRCLWLKVSGCCRCSVTSASVASGLPDTSQTYLAHFNNVSWKRRRKEISCFCHSRSPEVKSARCGALPGGGVNHHRCLRAEAVGSDVSLFLVPVNP